MKSVVINGIDFWPSIRGVKTIILFNWCSVDMFKLKKKKMAQKWNFITNH